jgi:hypothetical protein
MFKRMLMGITIATCIAVGVSVGLSAQSTSYKITVALDETTRGDFDVVGTSLESAALGSEVSRAVRRLGSSAAGELALLANQRISGGNVLLDDGSSVVLGPEDELHVSVAGEPQVEYVAPGGARKMVPRKTVVIVPGSCDNGRCSMKPTFILVYAGGQCRKAVLFSHPPTVVTC